MSTKTDVLPEIDDEVSDPDGKAHYVRIKALLAGGPVVALCGKKYVPSVIGQGVFDREPCKPCAELMDLLKMMEG